MTKSFLRRVEARNTDFSRAWELNDGEFCILVFDSYGDGGTSGTVTFIDEDGTGAKAAWVGNDYQQIALFV